MTPPIDLRLVPNLELPALLGYRIEDGFVVTENLQRTSAANVFYAGEPTGIGSVDLALLEGRIAGLAAAGRIEEAGPWSLSEARICARAARRWI